MASSGNEVTVTPSSPDREDPRFLQTHTHDYAEKPPSVRSAGPSVTETKVKVKYDLRQSTQDGFGAISVVSVFMAGVQAQVLAFTLGDTSTAARKVINGLWLAGLSLDVYATILSALSQRWFSILTPEDATYLSNSWLSKGHAPPSADTEMTDRTGARSPSILEKQLEGHRDLQWWASWAVATGLFSAMPTLAAGFICFIAGLFIFSWVEVPLAVSIIATIPLGTMMFLVGAIFLLRDDTRMKHIIIDILRDKRGAW